MMEDLFQKFIKSCLELGSELLEKESLTEKEEQFLKDLDTIVEKNLN